MAEWRGKVDGGVEFGVMGDSDWCRSEMAWYAQQYADEGRVVIEERVGNKWVRRASYGETK